MLRNIRQKLSFSIKKSIIKLIPGHNKGKLNITKKLLFKHRKENEQELLEYLSSNVKGYIPSYALSQHDELFKPSQRLIKLCLEFINCAFSEIELGDVAKSFPREIQEYIYTWPGEHYRLLAAVVKVLQPKNVIEIGTFTGASTLSMKKYIPRNSKIITFDIVPWDKYPETGLKNSDFDWQLEQIVADLSDRAQAVKYYNLLRRADLIFVDASKDGITEKIFCDMFDKIGLSNNAIVIFDDIRFVNMIKIWREIKHPKLDLTPFAHWSGTGIVEWG